MNMEKAADKLQIKEASLSGLNLRYEKKFIFIGDHVEDVKNILYLNSYCFNEIYEKRKINNVYFDDNDLNFYKQNVSGVGSREKYRLRWYGDDFSKIEGATLEIKRKFGEVGDKISSKLPQFKYDLSIGDAFELQRLLCDQLDARPFFQNAVSQLNPTLFNSYERRYFLSACQKFRVTLDYHQHFYDPAASNFLQSKKSIDKRIIVLELKYSTQDDMEARNIPQQFTSRVSRNSKYVQGIDLIQGLPLF